MPGASRIILWPKFVRASVRALCRDTTTESLQIVYNFRYVSSAIHLTSIKEAFTLPSVEMNSHEAPVPLANALALCSTRPPAFLRAARVPTLAANCAGTRPNRQYA
jgi:hypothetical protein